jgi:hypothetical protein
MIAFSERSAMTQTQGELRVITGQAPVAGTSASRRLLGK